MIAFARAGPTPGSASSVFSSAEFTSISAGPAGTAAARAPVGRGGAVGAWTGGCRGLGEGQAGQGEHPGQQDGDA